MFDGFIEKQMINIIVQLFKQNEGKFLFFLNQITKWK